MAKLLTRNSTIGGSNTGPQSCEPIIWCRPNVCRTNGFRPNGLEPKAVPFCMTLLVSLQQLDRNISKRLRPVKNVSLDTYLNLTHYSLSFIRLGRLIAEENDKTIGHTFLIG